MATQVGQPHDREDDKEEEQRESDREGGNNAGWKPSGGQGRGSVETTPWDTWSTGHLEEERRYTPPRLESASGHHHRGAGVPTAGVTIYVWALPFLLWERLQTRRDWLNVS